MENLLQQALSFFVENFPSPTLLLTLGPLGLAWSFGCLWFSGILKRDYGWKTGYSRKTFHFLTFFSVAILQVILGTSAVCLFGGMTSLVILFSLIKGDGNVLYEALAREKDEPHRTYFIVAPYFATLIGGLLGNMLFAEAALMGYLAAGVGDAAGEVVGTRFGKHIYKVKGLRGVEAIRSWEGSAGVFVFCLLALGLGVWISPAFEFSAASLYLLPSIALVCSVVEAVSPHGWDNFTMQVIPSWLAVLLL